MTYVSRVVDLLDPVLNPHLNMDLDEARAPRAQRRSVGGPRDRRIVRAGRLRGHHGAAGAVDGSPDAVLPRQAARGTGAVRRGSHRPLHSGAHGRRPRAQFHPTLHPHGPGPLRRRPGARRLSRSGSDLHALLHAGARDAARRSRRASAAATSARSPTKSPSGCARIDARSTGRSRSASRSRAASTADRCSSSPTTSCCVWDCRRRG